MAVDGADATYCPSLLHPHAAAERRCHLTASPAAGRAFHRGIWRFGFSRASGDDIGLW